MALRGGSDVELLKVTVGGAVGCSPALCGEAQARSMEHKNVKASKREAWPHGLLAGCVALGMGSN